jgi:hypothetical protein
MTATVDTPTPFQLSRRKKTPNRNPRLDLDRFLTKAKTVVADNYNKHRKPEHDRIPANSLEVVWYTRLLDSWKAVITTPAVKSLLWMVTYDDSTGKTHLEFYKKLTNVVISPEDPQAEGNAGSA